MSQKWGRVKPMLPVASGGLHPGLLPELFDIYGTMDIAVQLGGGTQGHPMGIEAGARAVMQAIEAYREGSDLDEYAKTHKELKVALDKWGTLNLGSRLSRFLNFSGCADDFPDLLQPFFLFP